MAKKKKTKHTECQNDHTKLVGDYCHTCGQRADEPRRIVIGLVQDFLVDTLAIDGKLARTIWLLLSRPGRLARRYLDGKRVRYSPPFRLYLFTSVFFFITAFWMADLDNFKLNGGEPPAVKIDEETLSEVETRNPEAGAELRRLVEQSEQTPGGDGDAPSGEDSEDNGKVDSEGDGDGDGEDDNRSFQDMTFDETNYNGPDWLRPHVKRMFEAAQRVSEDPRLFIAESKQNLPRALLLAPVLYALLLLLLYFYRRKFYVYDHLVVSLYMHAAFYAYLLSAILISLIPKIGWLWFVPIVWGSLQPIVVLRQAYGSNWLSVILKWIITMTIYITGLALIITFGLTYSLYQS